jgi:hypothetical protein
MTRTAIICLAIVLILMALTYLGFVPSLITAIALIIEAILIIAGSRLTT